MAYRRTFYSDVGSGDGSVERVKQAVRNNLYAAVVPGADARDIAAGFHGLRAGHGSDARAHHLFRAHDGDSGGCGFWAEAATADLNVTRGGDLSGIGRANFNATD